DLGRADAGGGTSAPPPRWERGSRAPPTSRSLPGWARCSGRPWPPQAAPGLCVRLLQLTLGPFHGVLGLHALDGLGVHVHEDVLDQRLGRLPARRTGIARPAAKLRCFPERDELRVLLPQGMPLPVRRRADGVAIVRRHPLVVL